MDVDTYAFDPADQAEFESLVGEMLEAYRSLNLEARELGLRRWHEIPKHHFSQHIGLQSRYYNPRWGWCYPDEDAYTAHIVFLHPVYPAFERHSNH